jgi:hypothetical protein
MYRCVNDILCYCAKKPDAKEVNDPVTKEFLFFDGPCSHEVKKCKSLRKLSETLAKAT